MSGEQIFDVTVDEMIPEDRIQRKTEAFLSDTTGTNTGIERGA